MGIKVAQLADGATDAGAMLSAQLGDPAVVVYFASPKHDPQELAAAIAHSFPSAVTFGCTSAGELVSGSMTKGAVVAMGFGAETVSRSEVAVVEGLRESTDGIARAFAEWERRLGLKMLDLDPERWIGLVLIDGLSGAEERVMDRIGNLTNVIFIGGSAGDDVAFKKTYVAANGRAVSDAAVLALLECPNGFDIASRAVRAASGSPKRKTLAALSPRDAGPNSCVPPMLAALRASDRPTALPVAADGARAGLDCVRPCSCGSRSEVACYRPSKHPRAFEMPADDARARTDIHDGGALDHVPAQRR